MNEELLKEFSNILKEKNIDLNEILGNQNSNLESQKNKENENSNSSSPDNIDISTILKLKSILDTYNTSSSQNVQLLLSLKPFLRDSRKSKIDKYAKMLKVAEIMKNLDLFGGD